MPNPQPDSPLKASHVFTHARSWADMYRGEVRADLTSTDAQRCRYAACDLAEPSTGMPELLVARHARARGLPFGRHAASLVFQRYCHRVCGLAVVSYLTTGAVLDLSPARTSVQFVDGSPDVVYVSAEGLTPVDLPGLAAALVDAHLLPIASAIHDVARVAPRNLLGNIAASIAKAVAFAAGHIGVGPALEFGESFAATRRDLGSLGSYRVIRDGDREGLFFDRKTCCHWYAAPDGRFCSWCSRVTEVERTRRFRAAMTPEGTQG